MMFETDEVRRVPADNGTSDGLERKSPRGFLDIMRTSTLGEGETETGLHLYGTSRGNSGIRSHSRVKVVNMLYCVSGLCL